MTDTPKSKDKPERLAKFLASAGVASRRDSERFILQGRVQINGQVVQTPAINVTSADQIRLDGTIVKPADDLPRLFRYHKPLGLLTTNRDPDGRPTIFDHMPDDLPRVVTVGRLDLNSEGLLLLTTSGAVARALELPASQIPRTYRVRAHGTLPPDLPTILKQGITIDGVRYGSVRIHMEPGKGSNHWLEMTLTEGKNREIRRILDHFDLQVNRLIRVAYGPFTLDDLPRGAVDEVPARIVKRHLAAWGISCA